MSEFRVEVNKLKRDASTERMLAPRIRLLAAEIRAIAGSIHFDSSVKHQIQRNLNAIADSSMNLSQKVTVLAGTLETIALYYEQTENRISGQGNKPGRAIIDSIRNARDNIREFREALGMDPACAFSGDPVNLANGNYVYEKEMFQYDTVISMNLRFFYNVLESREGTLGKGWRHNFETCLLMDGEQYGVLFEDGSEQLFRKTEEDFEPYGGTQGSLKSSEEGFIYTDPENIRYCFDQDGHLLSEQTQDDWRVDLSYEDGKVSGVSCTDGIALFFGYSADGKLETVRDQADRTVFCAYDEGKLTSLTDPFGRTTRYLYDEQTRLCGVVTPDGITALQNEYDDRNRTVRQIFPDGGIVGFEYSDEENIVTMTRQNGSPVRYIHDGQKRNVRNIYPDGEESFAYDQDNHKISYTDKNGNESRYGYDAEGRISSFTNALGNTLSFHYTDSGQLAEFSLNDTVLGSSEYDERNHQVRNINANGAEVLFAYDEKGRVTTITHEDGSLTSLTYDEWGNVIKVEDPLTGSTEYEYDDCHRVVSSVDALGRKICYVYDAADQLIRVTDPEGNERNYQYDGRGNLIEVVDFNGGSTRVDYDDCGRPVRYTDPDGYVTLFEYDKMGNIVRKTAADGGVTEYEYDSEDRRILIRDPMGGVEKAVYDPMGNLIERIAQDDGSYRFSYDALNRPVSVTDPLNRTRSAEYDMFGNVTRVTFEDGSQESYEHDLEGNTVSYTDTCGYTRRYSYDALGDLTEVRDDKGILARYEYLAGGRLAREFRQDGSEVSYTYDAAGNIIRMEDSANGIWKLTYDALDRIVRTEHEGGETESYEYDVMGNITAVTDGEGNRSSYSYSKNGALLRAITAGGMETRYSYDPCYRLKSVLKADTGSQDAADMNSLNKESRKPLLLSYKRDLNGNILSIQEADGGVTEFAYDACGRIIGKKDADGYVLRCSYEKDGTEKELTFSDGRKIRYQYDALKRLEQIEDWLGITSFRRDAAGRILSAEDPSGNKMTCAWSGRGECEEMMYPDGRKARYGYDEKGRLAFTDVGSGKAEYEYFENGRLKKRTLPGGLGSEYAYDQAGRIRSLTSVQDGRMLEQLSYDYDRCGRKTRILGSEGNGNTKKDYRFSYDPSGCLTGVFLNGAPVERYAYDRFGNRTASLKNGVRTDYAYDTAGRLSASRTDGIVTQFRYDHRGNLTGKRVNGIETLALHFGALNRLEKAVSGDFETSYQYDGLARLVGKAETTGGKTIRTGFFHDYRQEAEQLLAMSTDGQTQDYIWDGQPFFSAGAAGTASFLQDERMTTSFVMKDQKADRIGEFTSFGADIPGNGSSVSMLLPFGFTSYLNDPVTGLYHGGAREYDAKAGRFISRDPYAGGLMQPITLNPFLYCMSDPLNNYDPTGAIVAWLAGGIVGAVGNCAVKFAGDVVKSVKNGKWSGSSWQSYVGTAAGGFVQGSVFVVAGPTAAGAAGAATETLVTNGLNMATGVKGYRKEDGYTVGKLLGDTAISGAKGAAAGFVFGKAGECMTKYVKIPGITTGRGSFAAVWKQVMTKANRDIIANVSMKTVMKGIVAYGFCRGVDKMIGKGIEEIKNTAKEYGIKAAKGLWKELTSGKTSASVAGAFGSMKYMGDRKGSATCPFAGI